jgi:hypothetical protein
VSPGSYPTTFNNMSYTETNIAKGLAFGLQPRSVLVVPNCSWTGSECDLLVIEQRLRIIDVEIKISRADLRADAKKDKWWVGRPWSRRGLPGERRQWPDKVWKHYYVLPAHIWADKLLDSINKASGVILVELDGRCKGGLRITVKRKATPNKEAKPISAADAIDLARLASLRMWNALTKEK